VSSFFTSIITDYFGGAREKLSTIEDDKKNNCFICGKTNEEVEATGLPFKVHIENIHNVWYYFLYIDYLQKMY
jgi:hypothetical protein